MLKIKKIEKSNLDLKVNGQVCSDDCLTDCEIVEWVGNRNQATGCRKVVICNPYLSTLM